jgi:ATP-dependent Lhr-like helicase
VLTLPAPSPFALPLMIERLREQLSTEKLKDRLARLVQTAEAALQALPAQAAASPDGSRPRAPRRRKPPVP